MRTPSHREQLIARRLLRLQFEQDQWRHKIDSIDLIDITEPISDSYLLLDLALDILRVPRGKHDYSEYFESELITPGRPEFSRDSYVEQWSEIRTVKGTERYFKSVIKDLEQSWCQPCSTEN